MGKFPAAFLLVAIAAAQAPDSSNPNAGTTEAGAAKQDTYEENHILGVVPNYTTVNQPPKKYQPISPREKFKLATGLSNENLTLFLKALDLSEDGTASRHSLRGSITKHVAEILGEDESTTVQVPSGMWLEFGMSYSPGNMKLSFQAARSIG